MRDTARALISGHLGKDLELRYAASGLAVGTGSIASSYYDKRSDDWLPSWFNYVILGNAAELAALFALKGAKVALSGDLRVEQYEKDGERRTAVKVVVDYMVKEKDEEPSETLSGDPDRGEAKAEPEFDDDIPF